MKYIIILIMLSSCASKKIPDGAFVKEQKFSGGLITINDSTGKQHYQPIYIK